MTRLVGIGIGLGYFVISFLAFQNSAGGWAEGHADLGFWWAAIAILLAIAGLGAVGGTLIHTRKAD